MVSDIPAGEGKNDNLIYSVTLFRGNINSAPFPLTLMRLAEARNCLAFFDGLILKNLFSVKNLRVQLFLPWVLKIRLHPLFPSKKNSKCIKLSFYQNWCEKARSKLCYPRPNMCQTLTRKRGHLFSQELKCSLHHSKTRDL